MIYWLGLGANLGCVRETFLRALQMMQDRGIEVLQVSSLYHSPPMGPSDQPDFTNAVAEVSSSLSPEMLMDVTQEIERLAGRKQRARWRERELDLDLLLAREGERWLSIDSAALKVPHVGLRSRAFVIQPLLELHPDMCHPEDGKRLQDILAEPALREQCVTRIEEEQQWYRRNSVPSQLKA